jgi:tRNA A37 threonylcarbamoyltransferase TsaD
MKSFFEPAVRKIILLLDRQLRLANEKKGDVRINIVVLCGGFGDSRYLNNKLRGWCENQTIRLICPANP